MFYVILRHPKDGSVVGFVEDGDGKPVVYKSEESAHESMEEHVFQDSYETIEL